MGFIKDVLSKSIEVYREEILPLRGDLMKAGILKPDKNAYDQKTSLVDPWSYGSVSQGYKEKNSLIDYQKCRQITYADPIIAAIIQTRLNQVASFAVPQIDKYSMGFKISMSDREAKPTPKDKAIMKEIEQFIMNCGVPENFEDTPEIKKRENFEHFLRKITRDSLSFDQINFEIQPRNDGLPYAFQAVDAATIKLIPDKKERVERMNGADTGHQHNVMSFGNVKQEFTHFEPKHPKYCQVINGVIRHEYDEWEMCFGVRNPRTDLLSYGYGYGEIEMLITTITSHMNAENYNRKFFSQGSAIKGLLTFEGNVPPEQLEAFRRQWYQQVTGVNNAWKTPIMAMGENTKLNWTSLHSSNREMEFGKWMEYCIKSICGVYQIDPIEIGFDISKNGSSQSGGGGGGLGNGNQAERLDYSRDKGLRPLLTFIQTLLNEYIVKRIDPNYMIEFVGLNDKNEKDDLDKAVQQVKSYKTINEIRAENDLAPLKEVKGPGDVILDPSWINYIQAQQQAADAKENAAKGLGPDGQPLPPNGGAPGQPGQEDPNGMTTPEPGHEGDEDTSEEEPDYNSMSVDELQKEYDKLQPKEGKQPAKPKAGSKPKLAQPQNPNKPPMKKSMVFEL